MEQFEPLIQTEVAASSAKSGKKQQPGRRQSRGPLFPFVCRPAILHEKNVTRPPGRHLHNCVSLSPSSSEEIKTGAQEERGDLYFKGCRDDNALAASDIHFHSHNLSLVQRWRAQTYCFCPQTTLKLVLQIRFRH